MTPLKHYGGVARQDRVEGRYCDKAWHLTGDKPVIATAVLQCADCARVYARCAQCNRGHDTAANSMRAHRFAAHRAPRTRIDQ